MAKYKNGTEFIDPQHNIKMKIVNYDDCSEMYICEDEYGVRRYRVEENIEKAIKGEVTPMKSFSLKSLSNNNLQTLLADIHSEIRERESRERQNAWRQICVAVSNYIDNCGSITINVQDGRAEYEVESMESFADEGLIIV